MCVDVDVLTFCDAVQVKGDDSRALEMFKELGSRARTQPSARAPADKRNKVSRAVPSRERDNRSQ